MSCRGLHMALQRIVSLGLAIAFVATLGHLSWAESAGLLAAAAVSYVLWPVPAAPRGSHLYARGPAVVGPDVMGLVLVAFFADTFLGLFPKRLVRSTAWVAGSCGEMRRYTKSTATPAPRTARSPRTARTLRRERRMLIDGSGQT